MKCVKCKHCGKETDISPMDEMEAPEMETELEGEAKAKDDVLAELIEMMQGSLGSKLKSKPAVVSVEMVSTKPKKEEDEDEDEIEEG